MTGISEEGLQRIQAQLKEMQQEFVNSLPSRLDTVREHWDAYARQHDEESGRALLSSVHKIAGTSIVYGLTELGELARDLDERLSDELDGIAEIPDRSDFAAQMSALIASVDGKPGATHGN